MFRFFSLNNHNPGIGAGLLAVKSGFILFIKSYQFSLQINTLKRERVLASADFGCRWFSQLWRVTEPAAGYREPLWS